MKRLLYIIVLSIVSISCVLCENETQKIKEDIFMIKSPISVVLTIPQLGIYDAHFEYPLEAHFIEPSIDFDEEYFTFQLRRKLVSTQYPNITATLELYLGGVTRPFMLYTKYAFQPMDENYRNSMYATLYVKNSNEETLYSYEEPSSNGWVMFTEYELRENDCFISGLYEFTIPDNDGDVIAINGIFTDNPCYDH